jgi:hypothetical protein
MQPTTTTDPYPNPFNWSPALELECAEERLYNLLPCNFQCEQGWLPLLNGEFTACWECQSSAV